MREFLYQNESEIKGIDKTEKQGTNAKNRMDNTEIKVNGQQN